MKLKTRTDAPTPKRAAAALLLAATALSGCEAHKILAERLPVVPVEAIDYALQKRMALTKNTFFLWPEPKTWTHVGQASRLAGLIQDMDDERATLDDRGQLLDQLMERCSQPDTAELARLQARVDELMQQCPAKRDGTPSCAERAAQLDTWLDSSAPDSVSNLYSTRKDVESGYSFELFKEWYDPTSGVPQEQQKPQSLQDAAAGLQALDQAIAAAWDTFAGPTSALYQAYPVMPGLIEAKKALKSAQLAAEQKPALCGIALASIETWLQDQTSSPANVLPLYAERSRIRNALWAKDWEVRAQDYQAKQSGSASDWAKLLALRDEYNALGTQLHAQDLAIETRWDRFAGKGTPIQEAFSQMPEIVALKKNVARLDSDGREAVDQLQRSVVRYQTAPSQVFFERKADSSIKVVIKGWAVAPQEVNSDKARDFTTEDTTLLQDGVLKRRKYVIEAPRYRDHGGWLEFDAVIYSGDDAGRLDYLVRQEEQRIHFSLQRIKEKLSQKTHRFYYGGKFSVSRWMPVYERNADGSIRTRQVQRKFKTGPDGRDWRDDSCVADPTQPGYSRDCKIKTVTTGVVQKDETGTDRLEWREGCDPLDELALCHGQVSMSGGL